MTAIYRIYMKTRQCVINRLEAHRYTVDNVVFTCPNLQASCVSHPQSGSRNWMHLHFMRFSCPQLLILDFNVKANIYAFFSTMASCRLPLHLCAVSLSCSLQHLLTLSLLSFRGLNHLCNILSQTTCHGQKVF